MSEYAALSAAARRPDLTSRVEELTRDLDVPCRRDAPLGPLTWLGIGGPTPFLFLPRHIDTIPPLVQALVALGIPPRWLGAGSNLLIDDAGIGEPVIATAAVREEPSLQEGGLVSAAAGTALPGFARWCAARGLAGLEFAEGIPGSVGGSVAMNAGAFGKSIGERTARLRLLRPDGRLEERDVQPGDFSYRRALFAEQGAMVLAAAFRLERADAADLARQLEEHRRHRRDTQPLSEQSAGCIFRNPPQGSSAGALIERCGLKGLSRGAAAVSDVHANFVINRGGARLADVRALIDEVKARVLRQSGVALEEEIRVWARGR